MYCGINKEMQNCILSVGKCYFCACFGQTLHWNFNNIFESKKRKKAQTIQSLIQLFFTTISSEFSTSK